MKRACPGCGSPVSNEARQFCPKCEQLDLSDAKLSKDDLDRLAALVSVKLSRDWKLLGKTIAAVFAGLLVLVGVIDAVIGFNLKESMAVQFQKHEFEAKKTMEDRLDGLDGDIKRSLAQVDVQMRSNITWEFEAPAIQAIVQDVAKTEARAILEGEIQPAVDRFHADALFIRTIARARAYDFKAYQELLEIGRQTNDNAVLADQTLVEIDRLLQRDRSEGLTRIFMMWDGTNIDTGPFTSDEIALFLPKARQDRTSFNREGFVNTVAGLKQPLLLAQLVQWFTNETDLAVADRLTIAISGLAGEDFHPRDLARIEAWWQARSGFITNWPTEALESGLKEFSSAHYEAAVKAFERVLELDPRADRVRAHAIACCWELGQTNRAATLAKEFKDPSARWAQWAAAKAEMEAGNISNATVRCASMATNFPTMGMPAKGSPVLRRMNWGLFEKLTAIKTP